MIQSMTGYGSCEKNGIKVEVRSLNHRFLDINIKAPSTIFKYDITLRKFIKEIFSRGRFDVSITFLPEQLYNFTVNEEFAANLLAILNKIRNDYKLEGNIGIDTILSFKEMLITDNSNIDEETLIEVFKTTLLNLKEMREKEGEALLNNISTHLTSIEDMVKRIISLSSDSSALLMSKYMNRIKELLKDIELDEARILQESAILTEKADISEETVRIHSHLEQFRINLLSNDNIGRKSDFLIQELNREVNTISSKTNVYNINAITVDMKGEIEKIREQIQNIQ